MCARRRFDGLGCLLGQDEDLDGGLRDFLLLRRYIDMYACVLMSLRGNSSPGHHAILAMRRPSIQLYLPRSFYPVAGVSLPTHEQTRAAFYLQNSQSQTASPKPPSALTLPTSIPSSPFASLFLFLFLIHVILRLLLIRPQNPPPLLKHIREQRIETRHVRGQYSPQPPPILLIQLARRRNSLINEPSLAGNTEGVEHEEGVVPVHIHESALCTNSPVYI